MSITDSVTDAIPDGEIEHVDEPPPGDAPFPARSEELARRDPVSLFELDERRAQAYATSGYWPDAKSQAQALVKIEAGRELGLPAIVAMSEVHVIQGKPTLGAGALAALVKTSGRYDYRIVEHTEQRCTIRFFDLQTGERLGESVFTLDDARKAGLAGRSTWKQYPRNMLFARALTNGVAWYCPDVAAGRIYTPEELDVEIVDANVVESQAVEIPEAPASPIEEPATVEESGTIPAERHPTAEQKQRIIELIAQLTARYPEVDWPARAREICGVPGDRLTQGGAAVLIDRLERELANRQETR